MRTVGSVAYDETRVVTVSPKFEGWAERLFVDFTGAAVRRGQPLLAAYSPMLVAAQEELILAAQLARSRPEPFLSSRPTPILRWLAARIPQTVQPGERLLYEEGGFAVPGLVEPFGEGRYSGLIPFFAPVIGAPYFPITKDRQSRVLRVTHRRRE